MKIRDFDRILLPELLLTAVASAIKSNNIDIEGISPDVLYYATGCLHNLTALSTFRTIRLADDYKELSSLYNGLIINTSKFMEELDFRHPIEVFSAYVYMYRNGLFSYNNEFRYDMDLKDLPNLYGVDMVRGKGVCRTISSMLSDLYNMMGFSATNVTVSASRESISQQQKICDIELKKKESLLKLNPEIMEAFIKLTNILHMGNHQITFVKDENSGSFYLDPTNDGLLRIDDKAKNLSAGTGKMHICNLASLYVSLLGAEKYTIMKHKPENDINEEEYRKIYLRTLNFCKDNLEYLKEFAQKNEPIYKDIYNISEEQRGLIGRLIPIIPKNKEIILNRK